MISRPKSLFLDHNPADEVAKNAPYWTDNASQRELHKFVIGNLQELNEEYTEPFRATVVADIVQPPLQIRDMVPPALSKGRNTWLGNAIHPTSVVRVRGMAMKDAIVLAEMLAQRCEAHELEIVLKQYENEMTGQGN